jgi:hypothetical protein
VDKPHNEANLEDAVGQVLARLPHVTHGHA